jgi:Holliday junction resolvasome RuvABC endonuclease subunit
VGRILAIDSSVTSPGFAVMESGRIVHFSSLKLKVPGPGRWVIILDHIQKLLQRYQDMSFCVIENYAYSRFELSTLAELMGVIKWHLMMEEIPYGTVAPNTLKLFFAGHGHANKDLMMAEAKKRGHLISNDNEADAIALAYYGHAMGFEGLKNNWPASPSVLKDKKGK